MSPPVRLGTVDPAPPPGTPGLVAGLGGRVRSIAMGENVDMTATQYLVHGNTILADHVRQRLLGYGAQLHTLGVLAGVLGTAEQQEEYRAAVANAVGSYFEGLLSRSQRRAWYERIGVLDAASIGLGYWYKLSGAAADVVGADEVGELWDGIGDTLIETDPERFITNATTDFIKSLVDSCKARWDLFWNDLREHGLYVAYGRVQIDAAFLAAEIAIDVVIGIATGGAAAAASVGLKIVGRRVSATVTRVTIRAANRAARGVPDSGILKVVNIADDQIDPAIKRAVLDEDLLGTGSPRRDMARRGEQPDPDVDEPSGGGGNRDGSDGSDGGRDRDGRGPRGLSEADRIKLEDGQKGALDELQASGIGKDKRGPVLTSVIDPETGDVFHGINGGIPPGARTNDLVPPDLDPVLQNRIDRYNTGLLVNDTRQHFPGTNIPVNGNPGHHSEIWAMNQALQARRARGLPVDDSTISNLFLSNKRISNQARWGESIVRCPDCSAITRGANDVSDQIGGPAFRSGN